MEFEQYLNLLEQRHASQQQPVVSFFDLDRTLIDGYSLTALAWQQIFNGDMGVWRFCKLGTMFLRYGLKRIDYNDMLGATVADIQGMPVSELIALSRQAFDVRLADWLYQEGGVLIDKHKALGHEVVMVTSATTYQAEPIAEALGIEHVLATTLEVCDGKVAGGVDACFGPGKVTAANAFVSQLGISLEQAYFYSDSADDLPLLTSVGYPVVVNGKPALVKFGQAQGWPELEFVQTGRDHFEALAQRRAA